MKTKKIHIALGYLSIYELNSFRKFLASPFHNQSEAILMYFDLLDKQIRSNKNLEDLEDEFVWKKINKNEPYDNVRMRKLSSDIMKLYESFLAYRELESDPTLLNSLKIKAFKSKQIEKLYPGLLNQISAAKTTTLNKSSEYYLHLFNIEKTILALQTDADRKSARKNPTSSLNIEEISLNLDVFYIGEKLKYYCTLLSWSRSYKIDKKIAGIEFILKLAKIPLFKDYPPVKMYYTISRTIIDENNIDHYNTLKSLINQYLHLFPVEEAKEIMDAAISYCVVKNNQGYSMFLEEVLAMYNRAMDLNLLLDHNGTLSPTSYRNIALYALRAKQFDWAINFIESNARYIHEDMRDNAYNFSYARLEFFRGDYDKVIDYLNAVRLEEFYYNANVRVLFLVAYYELHEYVALDSLFNSFNAWVMREKSLTKVKKEEFLKLIRFTKKLTGLFSNEKDKLQKLKDDVNKAGTIVSKSWLIEKIDEKIAGKRRS